MVKKIYKYHKTNEYLYDIIQNNQLYFAKPLDLNDPFDGWLRLGKDYLTLRAKEFFEEFLLLDSRAQELIKNTSKESLFDKFIKLYFEPESEEKTQQITNASPSFRICSFTKDPLNELMWAHYGEQSKGVCLEFDATKPPFPEKLMKVRYSNDILYTKGGLEVFDILTTKRKAWSYEKEYRFLGPNVPLLFFDKALLLTIIFGYKTTKESEMKIVELAKRQNYPNLKFKKVIMNPISGLIYLNEYDNI